MPPAEAVLICALSGRALAQSARGAGLRPFVLDRFADLDTREAAERVVRVPAGRLRPFAAAALRRAAARHAPPPMPLVWGSGLDATPRLLASLAEGRELLGSSPEALAALKDPLAFAALCARLGVPHPEIRAELPATAAGWLIKRRGGAGGGHIRPVAPGAVLGPGDYVQRRAAGRGVAALILGDGRHARVLAFSEQEPEGSGPFRFTTVLAPAALPPPLARAMGEAAVAIAEASGVKGLASADFMVDEPHFHLLEVNPRPGAALEACELALGPPLMALHVAACRGRLPPAPPPAATVAATRIVWAPADLRVAQGFAWPAWAADRTPGGTMVRAARPLCTVRATAGDGASARRLLGERAAAVLAGLTTTWTGRRIGTRG
jgi:predicted ATP-grasp superfamily ATP-dependent carboligase